MSNKSKSEIILALDYSNQQQAIEMAKSLNPKDCRLKVGKELFTAAGPDLVEQLQKLGFEIFLDLKFHDIPNTVAGACAQAAKLGVWMVNVHALGGRQMIEAACEAVDRYSLSGSPKTLLTAVTILTSHNQAALNEIGLHKPLIEVVESLAMLAKNSGADGIVCSAQEVLQLKPKCTNNFIFVTPGIRPSWAATGDQQRIMTPAQAQANGIQHLVIGRPITKAKDPQKALEAIKAELAD